MTAVLKPAYAEDMEKNENAMFYALKLVDSPEQEVELLHTEVRELAEQGSVDVAIDLIFENLNDWHCCGFWGNSEYFIKLMEQDIDFQNRFKDILIGLFTITLPAKDNLYGRARLMNSFMQLLDQDDVEPMLDGLW